MAEQKPKVPGEPGAAPLSPGQLPANDEDKEIDLETWKKRYADSTRGFQEFKEQSEKKQSDVLQELGAWKSWASDVQPYLEALAKDPKLQEQLRTKIKGDEVPTPPTDSPKPGEQPKDEPKQPVFDPKIIDEKVGEQLKPILELQEAQVINEFVKQKGWDQLPESDRKEKQAKLGLYLSRWTNKGQARIPLHEIANYLNDAYALAFPEDVVKEAELARKLQEAGVNRAALPAMLSGSASEVEKPLSDEEKKVASRMGIPEKEYAEQKKLIRG